MKHSKFFAAMILPMVSASTWAVQVTCTENKVTNSMQCVALSEVRASGESVRYAPLYIGGPKELQRTNFTVHTNCATGVTHLKDRAGVSFAGGDGNETRAIRELRQIICNAPLKPAKKSSRAQ